MVYRFVFHREGKPNLPSRRETEAILTSNHDRKTKVYIHSKAVAELAVLLAEKLNKKGIKLNLDLIYVSGLLHDIAKGKSNRNKNRSKNSFSIGETRLDTNRSIELQC